MLDKLREKYNSEENRFPIIRPETEKALLAIVAKRKPNSILELGSGVGYSGLRMLDVCKKANLVTVEKDKKNFEEALNNFSNGNVFDRVMPINADACDVVQSLANYGKQKFDIIFLDCAKSKYIEMASNLTQLLEEGGILFADNVLYMGLVGQDRSIPILHKHRTIVSNLRKFLDFCNSCEEFSSVQVVNQEDGFMVAIKK